MLNIIIATKSQKIAQKTSTPSTPYIEIRKDGASETAIQWFLKGGSREIVQGDKKSLFVQFGLCEKATTFALKVIPTKKEADSLKSKGVQIRELKYGINQNGGYGCSSLKKSIKNIAGLDFTDMATVYQGNLEISTNKTDNGGFNFIAKMAKVE
jgi:hypothetical protein